MALLDLCAETPDLSAFAAPGEADGNCGLAVDIFLDFARHLLPEARSDEVYFVAPSRWRKARLETRVAPVYSYRHAPHRWYASGCRWPGHVVAHVGEWLIDWTARQFNPSAPFPLVFRMPRVAQGYLARFGHI